MFRSDKCRRAIPVALAFSLTLASAPLSAEPATADTVSSSTTTTVKSLAGTPHGRVITSQRGNLSFTATIGRPGGDFETLTTPTKHFTTAVTELPCGVDHADPVPVPFSPTLVPRIPAMILPPASPTKNKGPTAKTFTSQTEQDVLVFYSESARIALGGNPANPSDNAAILAKIDTSVAAANTAYADSDIPITLRLLDALPIDYDYPSSENFTRALAELRSTTDGKIDQVHTLRDQYGADFVSLWLANSVVGGLANVNTASSASASAAFSVIRAENPVSTFVHELGHNQGCRHLRDSYAITPSSWFPDSFAHHFEASGDQYVTVMASTGDASDKGATRILRFANPSLVYLGTPTGVDNTADTARTLRANREVLAAFRTERASPARPIVTLKTPKRVRTKRPRLRLAGTASPNAQVTVRATGNRPIIARGTTTWSAVVTLKKRRTTVKVVATSPLGTRSRPAKAVIIRRPR